MRKRIDFKIDFKIDIDTFDILCLIAEFKGETLNRTFIDIIHEACEKHSDGIAQMISDGIKRSKRVDN